MGSELRCAATVLSAYITIVLKVVSCGSISVHQKDGSDWVYVASGGFYEQG